MRYPLETLQSQYAASPKFRGLIEEFDRQLSVTPSVDAFFSSVFDIDTAHGWGLDVLGRIVGISRFWAHPSDDRYLGFSRVGQASATENQIYPFDNGIFFEGVWSFSSNSNVSRLGDDFFRRVVKWKAFCNISGVSADDINESVRILLGDKDGTEYEARAIPSSTLMNITLKAKKPLPDYARSYLERYRDFVFPAGVSVLIDDGSI